MFPRCLLLLVMCQLVAMDTNTTLTSSNNGSSVAGYLSSENPNNTRIIPFIATSPIPVTVNSSSGSSVPSQSTVLPTTVTLPPSTKHITNGTMGPITPFLNINGTGSVPSSTQSSTNNVTGSLTSSTQSATNNVTGSLTSSTQSATTNVAGSVTSSTQSTTTNVTGSVTSSINNNTTDNSTITKYSSSTTSSASSSSTQSSQTTKSATYVTITGTTQVTTSTASYTTLAQGFSQLILVRFEKDPWFEAYSDQKSELFLNKSFSIETQIKDALKSFPIISVKVLSLTKGSVVANTTVTTSQEVTRKALSDSIVSGIPGTTIINPSPTTLPDWAVIIIAVACTLVVITLAFIITAIICRRQRMRGYNRYGGDQHSQTIEMNENWRYGQRNSSYKDDNA